MNGLVVFNFKHYHVTTVWVCICIMCCFQFGLTIIIIFAREDGESERDQTSEHQCCRLLWVQTQGQSSFKNGAVKTSESGNNWAWTVSDSQWLPMQSSTQEYHQEGWSLSWRARWRRNRDWSSNRKPGILEETQPSLFGITQNLSQETAPNP